MWGWIWRTGKSLECKKDTLMIDDDLPQPNYLCGQRMSPWDCVGNPGQCQGEGNTNQYGYPAHFDLQNANFQVTIEIDYEKLIDVFLLGN